MKYKATFCVIKKMITTIEYAMSNERAKKYLVINPIVPTIAKATTPYKKCIFNILPQRLKTVFCKCVMNNQQDSHTTNTKNINLGKRK